jgi:hypothetical protein
MQARDLARITRAGGEASYQGTERTVKQAGRGALMACGRWLVHGGSRVCGVPQCEVTRAVKRQEESPHALRFPEPSQWNHISRAVIGQSARVHVNRGLDLAIPPSQGQCNSLEYCP